MRATSKVALALSGGGFTGYLFEIGALTALDDLFEDGFSVNQFDFYVGVSAGSAAASLLANGIKPEVIFQANLTGERPYYFERRDIFAPAVGEGFKSMARAVQQLSPVLKLYIRHRREMGLIDLLEKAQESLPCGMYTLDPFARYLEYAFAATGLSNNFENLRHPLYIPAIDLESGNSVVFGEDGWTDVPISKAVTASSAAPIYFCPVRIKGRDYIDAGIGRFACFELAARKGVDFMLIIHPCSHVRLANNRPWASTTASKRQGLRGFLSIADQAARINLEARFSLALDLHIRQAPDKFFVVSPSSAESMMFDRSFLSFKDRIHLLRCGYLSVVGVVQEDFNLIRGVFAQHGIAISLAKIEERMRSRLQDLSVDPRAGQHAFGGSPERAGWSSAY
jgi:NTE family protein